MSSPWDVWYRLVTRKMKLVAEVPASQPDRRAWVSVTPFGDSQYAVIYSELAADKVEEVKNSWDDDLYLLDRQHVNVTGEAELERLLRQWLDDLEQLVQPGFCEDYPF